MHKWLENKVYVRKTLVATLHMTADNWDIFADEPGAEIAAASLNLAVEKAVRECATKDEARRQILKFMSTPDVSKFGANDTEPVNVLEDVLDNIYTSI